MKKLLCSLGIGILVTTAASLYDLVQAFAAPSVRPRPISHAPQPACYPEHARVLCA